MRNIGRKLLYVSYAGDTFFHKLRAGYHTLAYAGVRCHTSNLSENFVHAQNFQRIDYMLDIRQTYATHTLCMCSSTLHVSYSYVNKCCNTIQFVGRLFSVKVAYA